MNVGTIVRVLAPFTETYPDTYQITEVVTAQDQPIVFILGDLGGFDQKYLEVVE